MKAYDEAMAFLTDQGKVRLYTNEERAAQPCPDCGAKGVARCTTYRGSGVKRTENHAARAKGMAPRSEDETRQILEKLARRYAAGWRNQASEFHREARRYPR